MCENIDIEKARKAVGLFTKGNEPETMAMAILIAPCKCGQWWASIEGGTTWVQAVKVKE